jgi:hypothetical protein
MFGESPIVCHTIRSDLFREPLLALEAAQAQGRDDIVTLGDCWFYVLMEYERVYFAPEGPVPDIVPQTDGNVRSEY